MDCHNQISIFYSFKIEAILRQEKLYKLLEDLKVREQLEELHEEGISDTDDTKPIVYEDAVKAEIDFETIKVSEDYEAVGDFEIHSGERHTHSNLIRIERKFSFLVAQLNFEPYEAVTGTKTTQKRKKRKDPFRNAGGDDLVRTSQRKKSEQKR